MRERVADMLEEGRARAARPTRRRSPSRTFHSFGLGVLDARDAPPSAAPSPSSTRATRVGCVKEILRQLRRRQGLRRRRPSSRASPTPRTPSSSSGGDRSERTGDEYDEITHARLSRATRRRCARSTPSTSTTCLRDGAPLARPTPTCSPAGSERYRYVLVDEYQDTNRAQLELLRLLAGESQEHLRGRRRRPVASTRGAAPTCATSWSSRSTSPAPRW